MMGFFTPFYNLLSTLTKVSSLNYIEAILINIWCPLTTGGYLTFRQMHVVESVSVLEIKK